MWSCALAKASAKGAAEDHVDGGQRLFNAHGDDDALARRQPIRLHDDGGAALAHIGLGGFGRAETLVIGGGDGELRAEILGEALGALELGGGLRWPEGEDARRLQIIHQPRHQRRLRPHDHEADLHELAEIHDGAVIGHIQRHIAPERLRARIARGDEKLGQQRAARKAQRQRMLPPARADEKNIHDGSASCLGVV